ncbi:Uncharacterized protein Adt_22307 [Abeliophyllum distichum]|uniref:Gag-pol polyprotein n=1 Tax=Abeliophyllum distichum TaxID=126358 RepID=A0ABD1T1T9_9LAMI
METRQKATEEHLKKMDKDLSNLGLDYYTLSSKTDSSNKVLKSMYCKQDRVEELLQDMNSKYESIVAMMARLNMAQNDQRNNQVEGVNSGTEVQNTDLGHRSNSNQRGLGERITYAKLPKLNFPMFGGDNLREWVKKSNKYFQLPKRLKN